MHEELPILLLAPLGGLAANLLLQVVLSRISGGAAHLRNQFFSIALGAGIAIAILLALLDRHPFAFLDRIGYLLVHVMGYFFYAFCLFNVINAHVSSVRVRLLREYASCYPKPLPDTTLSLRYPASEILETRLARLQRGGQVRNSAGRYFLGGRFVLLVARFFERLRRLLLPR